MDPIGRIRKGSLIPIKSIGIRAFPPRNSPDNFSPDNLQIALDKFQGEVYNITMNNNGNQQEPVFLVFKHQFEMPNPYNGQAMILSSGYYVVAYPISGDKIALIGSLKDVSKAANSLLYFSIN